MLVAAWCAPACLTEDFDEQATQAAHGAGVFDGNAVVTCQARLLVKPVASSDLWMTVGDSVELGLDAGAEEAVAPQPVHYLGNSVYLSLGVAGDEQCQAVLLVKPNPQSELMNMLGTPVTSTRSSSEEMIVAEPVTSAKNERVYLALAVL
jgi:hypothetical protein